MYTYVKMEDWELIELVKNADKVNYRVTPLIAIRFNTENGLHEFITPESMTGHDSEWFGIRKIGYDEIYIPDVDVCSSYIEFAQKYGKYLK